MACVLLETYDGHFHPIRLMHLHKPLEIGNLPFIAFNPCYELKETVHQSDAGKEILAAQFRRS